jgi:hypothetical protein
MRGSRCIPCSTRPTAHQTRVTRWLVARWLTKSNSPLNTFLHYRHLILPNVFNPYPAQTHLFGDLRQAMRNSLPIEFLG